MTVELHLAPRRVREGYDVPKDLLDSIPGRWPHWWHDRGTRAGGARAGAPATYTAEYKLAVLAEYEQARS